MMVQYTLLMPSSLHGMGGLPYGSIGYSRTAPTSPATDCLWWTNFGSGIYSLAGGLNIPNISIAGIPTFCSFPNCIGVS